MNLLSPDSGLMKGLSDAVDAIWITILMTITSIPLVTIGAAVSAGYDAARRSMEGRGHVTANYMRALRANLGKATALWLPFLAVGAGLAYAWATLWITPLLIPKIALTLLWLIGFEWTFVLQSRFENTVGGTLANAYVLGVANIGRTTALAAMDIGFAALIVASALLLPGGLPLLLLLGYGSMLMLHVPVMEPVLRRYSA